MPAGVVVGSRSPSCLPTDPTTTSVGRVEPGPGGSLRGSLARSADMVETQGGSSHPTPWCGGRFETPFTLSKLAHASQLPPAVGVDHPPLAGVPTAGASGVRGGACTCDGVNRPTLPHGVEGGGCATARTRDDSCGAFARAAAPAWRQTGAKAPALGVDQRLAVRT